MAGIPWAFQAHNSRQLEKHGWNNKCNAKPTTSKRNRGGRALQDPDPIGAAKAESRNLRRSMGGNADKQQQNTQQQTQGRGELVTRGVPAEALQGSGRGSQHEDSKQACNRNPQARPQSQTRTAEKKQNTYYRCGALARRW